MFLSSQVLREAEIKNLYFTMSSLFITKMYVKQGIQGVQLCDIFSKILP